ncbi:MAG TPA: hypothetical protein VFK05_30500 [Polyangiaceae bacterium]|nr:hypothetical protein [Polyangiaceae bacterium]
MRSSLMMSLVGVTSMALALLVACGDDDNDNNQPVPSRAGESCTRTADCESGLSCIGQVCYKTAPPAAGGSGGDSSVTPTPPMLGGEGESCSSRLTCQEGLACFNNRCTVVASGEAGATGGSGIQLGVRGESCRVNGDCSNGLVCVTTAAGAAVCDYASFGVEPTGLTCSGECIEAADCCQLPMALHTSTIKSCRDIAAAIDDGAIDCSAPAAGSAATLCFQQATYCDCGKDTWSCDEDTHACVYGIECDPAVGSNVPDGCPSHSRLFDISAKTCNPDTKTCIGQVVTPTCSSDKACLDKQIFDSAAGDVCTADECTCYSGNKQCYRKCARDIDCGAGQVCDGKSKLCTPDAACVTDSQCAIANHDVAYKCNDGTCAQSCTVDRDCSPSGVSGAFTGRVCGADGFCVVVAQDCNEDSQCAPLTAGGLKPFCVTPAKVAGSGVSSAITN